ncbi:MAG TPA: NADH-quinone oxidoreductase subunit L [Armatimonadota bacterium]|nr:NADH-quinone oxidoreductase subunit L [Armatimonadota bacterium]
MYLPLLWLIPLLPLLACVINALAGKRMGKSFTNVWAVGSVWASCIFALYFVVAYVPYAPRAYETLAPFYWFASGQLHLQFGLLLDPLSMVMILIVTFVSALIHTYSIGYMADDPGYNRYFCYLNLFVFSMLMLVLGNSFLTLFVGWEGVGLCSYLLIGFWYDRQSATDAGKKAFIVNRVGDWAFVVGMALTFYVFTPRVSFGDGLRFGPVFQTVISVAHSPGGLTGSLRLVPAIAVLLFVGAMGKSAQLPLLYVWLPDAMEGPTPVSALIHAATMVTAGVYMVARCHVFYLASPGAMTLVAWIGLATAFVAATTATVQTDIKRALAYSTISQIGYMFIGAGVGAFTYSIFHLMTHAFFKALLFLGAGAVIHGMHNEQDMRKMGGLHKKMRPVAIQMGIAVLAISGFPFLSGFVSKDLILGAAAGTNFWLWFMGTVTAFITAFYMCRLWLMTFWGEEHWQDTLRHAAQGDHGAAEPEGEPELHPTPAVMLYPMWVLAFLSLVGGAAYWALNSFLNPIFGDYGSAPERQAFAPEWTMMLIAGIVFFIGAWVAWIHYGKSNVEPKAWMKKNPGVYDFLLRAWYIDYYAHTAFAIGGEMAARAAYEDIEVMGIDQGASNGLARGALSIGRQFRWAQTGVTADYALAMAFGVVCMVVYFLLR